ncbi:adenylate kinase 9 isoform X6 [Mastomys coucha]|uniref:adenylate kinase 9 isoform X6 n=1 Tax=Mastomys coucha TaxID=35658 RepID=UPI0012621F89|nr:adenylate kinase 9 isoform X6 [Mastomys coucha]
MASEEKPEEHPFADIFNEDETDRNCLLSKPACFIIFGKPGAGKTTLARNIAQAWRCIRVEALSVLEEYAAAENETGAMLQSLLMSGHSVPDELVTKLMLEKIKSPEVAHFGYIITEMPSLSQDNMTSLKQIEFVKNLELQPDIIINIKCSDYDLCQRISGQRQHSITGYVYTRDQWDPEIIESRRKKKKDVPKEGKSEEEEEEEEQEEEEAFTAEMQVVTEILQHLVQRPEDYLENIQITVKLYKELLLSALEEVMAEHNPQYLIELDGNKPPEELFMTVIERLKYLNVKRAAIITKLQSTEEEMTDILDTEELFRTVSSYKLIAPRYRWQRSKWARSCPVSLKDGNMYSGVADYSVSFLGKMYCLSSEETLKVFSLNPRPFLLPPMPLPPCKVFLFGPEQVGKTTLANLIAEYFKAKVIDFAKVVQPRFDSAREKLIKDTISEATDTAIKAVKERILNDIQAKKQEEKTLKELQMEYSKREYEDFVTTKSSQELHSSLEDTASPQGARKSSFLEIGQEEKTKSETPIPEDEDKAEMLLEEVTEKHPEVFSMLEGTLRHVKELNFEQPYEKQAEILEEIIKEETRDNKNRFPGAPKYGGWIVKNLPLMRELWMALMEKALIPDLVVSLSDAESNGKHVLNRLYLENKAEVDGKILERLQEEVQAKKKEEEEIRKVKEEELRMEEEKQRMMDLASKKAKDPDDPDNEADEEVDAEDSEIHEESEAHEIPEYTRESLLPGVSETSEVPEAEHEPEAEFKPTEDTSVEAETGKESKDVPGAEELLKALLPEFPEDGYPNVPEMEPLKEMLSNYIISWKQLEQMISDSLVPIMTVDIANKTPQELLQRVVETMEKPFKYSAWELNAEDYEEEAEDYQAEAEIEEEQEEEEEEEEEVCARQHWSTWKAVHMIIMSSAQQDQPIFRHQPISLAPEL